MREQAVELGEAGRFVRGRYGSRAGPLIPVGAGEWSRAYGFVLDGRDVVIRFGAHGEDFAKDARMARHSSALVPVPPVVELGEFFAVSERATGDFLDERDEPGMRAILPALLATMHAVRGLDVVPPEGYGRWRPDGSAPHRTWRDALLAVTEDQSTERIHGWRRALEASPTGAGPFDTAAEALRARLDRCPSRRELIHSDLLNRNILVRDGRIAAVLDWGNSMYGDGLYDLAWLLYWWPWYPAWRHIDIHKAVADHLAAAGETRPDVRLMCYQVHIGLDAQAYTAFTGRWDDLARNARQTARNSRRLLSTS